MKKPMLAQLNKPTAKIIIIILSLSAIILFIFANSAIQNLLFIFSCIIIATLSYFFYEKKNLIQTQSSKENNFEILLVDDSKPNRHIAIEILKPLPLTISEASSGKEALALIKKNTFSLILLDIEMQVMSGLELAQIIRAQEALKKRIPIIAISSHNIKDKKIEALTAGFDDFLSKPINNESLLKVLERWLPLSPIKTIDQTENTSTKIITNNSATINNKPIKTDEKENPTFEFIKNTSADNSATIKKTVDVKESLIYSRNNYNLAKDMLQMLIDMVKSERDTISQHYESKEWQELGSLIHKLNGGTCYCGVPRLKKQTDIINKALQNNEIPKVQHHFEEFLNSIDELIDWDREHDLDIIFNQ